MTRDLLVAMLDRAVEGSEPRGIFGVDRGSDVEKALYGLEVSCRGRLAQLNGSGAWCVGQSGGFGCGKPWTWGMHCPPSESVV